MNRLMTLWEWRRAVRDLHHIRQYLRFAGLHAECDRTDDPRVLLLEGRPRDAGDLLATLVPAVKDHPDVGVPLARLTGRLRRYANYPTVAPTVANDVGCDGRNRGTALSP